MPKQLRNLQPYEQRHVPLPGGISHGPGVPEGRRQKLGSPAFAFSSRSAMAISMLSLEHQHGPATSIVPDHPKNALVRGEQVDSAGYVSPTRGKDFDDHCGSVWTSPERE
ncbi:hypothetical protein AB0323_00010 [Arthrobacter sp. NPDC080031]|uniref:hypothetical protein n=1 Tax=Arthrobacter sp. NPDC080031 TaxID=3155918 RepID=UPI00344D0DE2